MGGIREIAVLMLGSPVLTADFAIGVIAISAGGGNVRAAINLNALMLDALVVIVGIATSGIVGFATGDIA